MARSIWSGTIQFGLVTIPVQLMVAVHEKSISFHMMSPDGRCRLRRKLFCPETGKEYDFKDTARGFEVAPDEYVIIDEAELKKLKPESGKSIDIFAFVKLDQIDPIYFNRTYYLRPDVKAGKAFSLLLKAMHATGRAAIAKFVLREREHLVTLRPENGILALHTMYYDDEVVKPQEIGGETHPIKATAKELTIASQLVEALSDDFKPAKFKDEYREQVEDLIRARAEGKPVHVTAEPRRERISDLMEALEKSLSAVKRPSSRAARKRHRHTRSRRRAA